MEQAVGVNVVPGEFIAGGVQSPMFNQRGRKGASEEVLFTGNRADGVAAAVRGYFGAVERETLAAGREGSSQTPSASLTPWATIRDLCPIAKNGIRSNVGQGSAARAGVVGRSRSSPGRGDSSRRQMENRYLHVLGFRRQDYPYN